MKKSLNQVQNSSTTIKKVRYANYTEYGAQSVAYLGRILPWPPQLWQKCSRKWNRMQQSAYWISKIFLMESHPFGALPQTLRERKERGGREKGRDGKDAMGGPNTCFTASSTILRRPSISNHCITSAEQSVFSVIIFRQQLQIQQIPSHLILPVVHYLNVSGGFIILNVKWPCSVLWRRHSDQHIFNNNNNCPQLKFIQLNGKINTAEKRRRNDQNVAMRKENYFSISSLWMFCRWMLNSSIPAVCVWHLPAAAAALNFFHHCAATVKSLHHWSTAIFWDRSDALRQFVDYGLVNSHVWLL